jgi:hypothetical protein
MTNITEQINKLYDKTGYLDKYGGSLFATMLILILIIIILSYFSIMNKIKPIKQNWINERCNPQVIPFAGIINKPDNMSAFEFTGKNFNHCLNTILQGTAQKAFQPIYYLTDNMGQSFKGMNDTIQSMREFFNYLRNQMSKYFKNIYLRIISMMIPIQLVFIKLMDTMAKFQSVLASFIFTIYSLYLAIKSMIKSVILIFISILIALVVIIAVFWIMPWTWPIAAAFTTLFMGLVIPVIIMIIFSAMILKESNKKSVPRKP